MRTPLPPVAAVTGFIDAINRGDVGRLTALMAPDHRVQVLQESPVTGRDAGRRESRSAVTIPRAFPPAPRQIPAGIYTAGGTNWAALGRPVSRRRGV